MAIAAIREGHNQYPPGRACPSSARPWRHTSSDWYGIALDPETDVLVTVGATEAIAAAMLALCEPGDEVVMFEPTYDSYAACVAMAGASPASCGCTRPTGPSTPTSWPQPWARAPRWCCSTRRTTRPARSSRRRSWPGRRSLSAHDLLAVTDEVYEHLVFDGSHVPLATLPGMAERTLTISSGGKTFSFTGWKVGWVTGPAPLVAAVRTAKQFLTYTSSAPFQLAIARGSAYRPAAMGRLATELEARRDQLCDGLAALGYEVFRPAATYFATTDITAVAPGLSAQEFCLALPERCGVVAIPSSVFYDPGTPKPAGRSCAGPSASAPAFWRTPWPA